MRMTSLAVALFLLGVQSIPADPLIGPLPYLCFDGDTTSAQGHCGLHDSPFKNLNFVWFHFKDYEDQVLESPGVSMETAECPKVDVGCPLISTDWFPDYYTDSVDEDDGMIDGLGQTVAGRGRSIWGRTFLNLTFDPALLGSLPTHVGLVWTDGGPGSTTVFEAWDENGDSLGATETELADGTNFGTTAEDSFLGAVNPGGISAFRVTNAQGGIEIDHLQYGRINDGLSVEILVESVGQDCIHRRRSHVSVTILGQSALDVADIVPETLRFNGLQVAPKGPGRTRCEMVAANLDGEPDLECWFEMDEDSWNGNETVGRLTGFLHDGTPIGGTTSICVRQSPS